jgi:hypothetical protein
VTATPTVIDAALHQVDAGFAVFALGRNTKVPATEHGFKNATQNPEWVRTQLAAPSAGNYGIVWPPDAQRTVVVFDLDNGDGATETWEDRLRVLMDQHGWLPPTKSTTTPSGGRHAFFYWPAGVPVPPGDELFGFTVRWPGRGYLVGPGSSIDGKPYQPGSVDEIADLPQTWVDAALEYVRQQRKPAVEGAFITIDGGYQLPERIKEGRRYATIRDYVASRYNSGLNPSELWRLVQTEVAPRFEQPKTEAELRGDFDRVMAKITERLGPPAKAPREETVVLELEDAPLTEYESAPIEWCWEFWLPRGVVTVMDGNPGVSKSTLVADLVARQTVGGSWPDGQPIDGPRRAMWITTEDDPGRVLRPRIEAAGGDPAMVLFVRSEVVFPAAAAAFRELLVKRSREPLGLGLVILDPLFSHIEAKVRTIADAEMRRGVMNPLNEAAEAARTALLVVRHFSKDTTASAVNRGAGSLGGIVGAARALWTVIADPEDETGETKAVGVSKLNYAQTPPALRYQVVSRVPPGWVTGTVSGIEWLGAAPVSITEILMETSSSREAQSVLAGLLADGPKASTAVLAQMKARGFGVQATRSAKARLGVRATKTGMTGGWEWSLPDAEGSGGILEGDEGVEGVGADSSNIFDMSSRAGARGRRDHHADSSEPSKITKNRVEGRFTRARPREGTEPELRVVRSESEWAKPCTDYANHRNSHRHTDAGWVCDACHPEGAA